MSEQLLRPERFMGVVETRTPEIYDLIKGKLFDVVERAANQSIHAFLRTQKPQIVAPKVPFIYADEATPKGFVDAREDRELKVTRRKRSETIGYQTFIARAPAEVTAIWKFQTLPAEARFDLVSPPLMVDESDEWQIPIEYEVFTSIKDPEVEFIYLFGYRLEAIGKTQIQHFSDHTVIKQRYEVTPNLSEKS